MADIKFQCFECGQKIAVDESGAGVTLHCPGCGSALLVPPLMKDGMETVEALRPEGRTAAPDNAHDQLARSHKELASALEDSANWRANTDRSKAELEKLRVELAASARELSGLRQTTAELNQLKSEVTRSNTELQQAQAKLAEVEELRAKATSELAAREQEKSSADAAVAKLQEDFAMVSSERDDLIATARRETDLEAQLVEAAASKSLVQSLERQLEELKEQMASLTTERDNAQLTHSQATSDLRAAREELATVGRQLEGKGTGLGAAEQELGNLRTRLEELQAVAGQVDRAQAETAEVRSELAALVAQREAAREESSNREAELAATHGEAERIRNELAATNQNLATALAERTDANQQLATIEERQREAAAAAETLKDTLVQSRRELDEARKQLETVSNERDEARKLMADREETWRAASGAADGTAKDLAELEVAREELGTLRRRVDELQSVAEKEDQAKAEAAQLRSEFEVLATECDPARSESPSSEIEVAGVNGETARMRSEVTVIIQNLRKAFTERDTARQQLSEIQAHFEQEAAGSEAIKNELGETRNELDELRKKLDATSRERDDAQRQITERDEAVRAAAARANDDAQAELNTARRELEELRLRFGELQAASENNAQATVEATQLRKELEALTGERDMARAESSSYQADLSGASSEGERIRNELEAISQRLKLAESERDAARHDLLEIKEHQKRNPTAPEAVKNAPEQARRYLDAARRKLDARPPEPADGGKPHGDRGEALGTSSGTSQTTKTTSERQKDPTPDSAVKRLYVKSREGVPLEHETRRQLDQDPLLRPARKPKRAKKPLVLGIWILSMLVIVALAFLWREKLGLSQLVNNLSFIVHTGATPRPSTKTSRLKLRPSVKGADEATAPQSISAIVQPRSASGSTSPRLRGMAPIIRDDSPDSTSQRLTPKKPGTGGTPVSSPFPPGAIGELQEELQTRYLDGLLIRAETYSLGAHLSADKVEIFAEAIDIHVQSRVSYNESVASLTSLLRQLRQLGTLPSSIEFQVQSTMESRAGVLAALGPPVGSKTGAVSSKEEKAPIYRDASVKLQIYKHNSGVDVANGGVGIYCCKGSVTADPSTTFSDLEVQWLNYGSLGVGVSGKGQENDPVRVIRIDCQAFLAAQETLNRRQAGLLTRLVKSEKEARRFDVKGQIWSLALSPDGRQLAVGDDQRLIRLLDSANGNELQRFEGHTDRVSSLAFSPNGTRLLSGSYDGTMRVWDVSTGKQVRSCRGHMSEVSAVAISPDGRRALSGGFDKTLILWDLETGEESRLLLGHQALISSVAFSPNGQVAASGSADQTVRLWDLGSGTEKRVLRGHANGVQNVSFSREGRLVLTSSGGAGSRKGALVPGIDNTVRIWDAETGEERQRLVGHQDWVLCANFSPDGRRVLTSSGGNVLGGKMTMPGTDNTVRLWDVTSGLEIARFEGHTNLITKVIFSLDGHSAYSSSWDGSVRTWKIPDDAGR